MPRKRSHKRDGKSTGWSDSAQDEVKLNKSGDMDQECNGLEEEELRIEEDIGRVKSVLWERYPCRQREIDRIVNFVGSQSIGREALMVQGPASTGKTAIVKDVMEGLGCTHVYVDGIEICGLNARQMYSTLLGKVCRAMEAMENGALSDCDGVEGRSKRKKRQMGTSTKVCESLATFVTEMGHVLESSEKGGERLWIVLDNTERVVKTNREVVVGLTRLREICVVDIGVILVSSVPWTSGLLDGNMGNGGQLKSIASPSIVDFAAYQSQELVKIFESTGIMHACSEHGSLRYNRHHQQFIRAVVPALSRVTNNLLDMKIALLNLWPHYIGPVERGEAVQGPRLMNKIKPLMQKMLSDLELGCLESENSASEKRGASNDDRQSKMLLEIPYMSKFLLLAGYIASRNAPTSDRAVFDTGYSNKRRRKDSQAMDRDVERSMAAKLRGTHSFPLERLLHIFYFVCEQHMPESDAAFETEDAYREWAAELQVSDVFVQISSLAALGFISRITAEILGGATFRCNISDDLAYEIAKNVDVRLNDYLKIG
eukprot:jgi/Picsp_1/125/NSC_00125-R1_origin recognition complex subunit 5